MSSFCYDRLLVDLTRGRDSREYQQVKSFTFLTGGRYELSSGSSTKRQIPIPKMSENTSTKTSCGSHPWLNHLRLVMNNIVREKRPVSDPSMTSAKTVVFYHVYKALI